MIRKIGAFGLKEISKSFIKVCIASILMGFIALGSYNFISQSLRENLALIIAIAIGAIVYGILVYLMRVPEVERALELMRGKIKGRMSNNNVS